MYLALSLLNLKGEALRSVSRVSWDRRALPRVNRVPSASPSQSCLLPWSCLV